jgi:hypothetical protein
MQALIQAQSDAYLGSSGILNAERDLHEVEKPIVLAEDGGSEPNGPVDE